MPIARHRELPKQEPLGDGWIAVVLFFCGMLVTTILLIPTQLKFEDPGWQEFMEVLGRVVWVIYAVSTLLLGILLCTEIQRWRWGEEADRDMLVTTSGFFLGFVAGGIITLFPIWSW